MPSVKITVRRISRLDLKPLPSVIWNCPNHQLRGSKRRRPDLELSAQQWGFAGIGAGATDKPIYSNKLHHGTNQVLCSVANRSSPADRPDQWLLAAKAADGHLRSAKASRGRSACLIGGNGHIDLVDCDQGSGQAHHQQDRRPRGGRTLAISITIGRFAAAGSEGVRHQMFTGI